MKRIRRSRNWNNTGSKEPRKITPKPRRNVTGHGGAEQFGLKPKKDLTVLGDSEQFGMKPRRAWRSWDRSLRDRLKRARPGRSGPDRYRTDSTEAMKRPRWPLTAQWTCRARRPNWALIGQHVHQYVCFPFLCVEHAEMSRNIICCSWLNFCNKLTPSWTFVDELRHHSAEALKCSPHRRRQLWGRFFRIILEPHQISRGISVR